MRAHRLNTMLVELMRSGEALTQYQQDPDALSARYGLTDEERERVKARDMGWLYLQGVHPYILTQFALSIRYDMGTMTKQVREATRHSDVVS